jgi:Domain of unknown function (DUF4434)
LPERHLRCGFSADNKLWMNTLYARLLLASMLAAVSAQAAVPSASQATFLNFCRELTPQQWAMEFQDMHAVGIGTIVIVSVGHLQATNHALAPEGLLYPSRYLTSTQPPATDRLEMILTLADRQEMQVLLGSLQTAADWTAGTELPSLRTANRQVAAEIVQRYGHHRSLVGWYFTQEIWMNWVNYYGRHYYGTRLLADWVTDMKAIDPRSRTAASVVMKKKATGVMPGLKPRELECVTAAFLRATQLDILMPQDGVGAEAGAPSLEDLPSYFRAMATGARAAGTGTSLWSVLELFTAQGAHGERFPPAAISRIQLQMQRTRPFVNGYISWIFGDDMSRQAAYYPIEARRLYRQYQALTVQ